MFSISILFPISEGYVSVAGLLEFGFGYARSLRVSDSSALDETRLASRMVGLSLSQTMIPCTETFSCSPTMVIEPSCDEENVDTTVGEAHGSSRRVTSSQRKRAEAIGDPGMYLGDPSKPFFIATSTCSGSVLQVIKDHDLKFGGTIKFIDGFGELEGKIGNWKYSIVVNKWKEIYERNDATPEYYLNLVFLRSWICSCVHLNLLTVLDLKLCSFKSSEGLGFAVVFI
ncbi:hypothetical protein YC2023_122896 [Brassica napus]